MVGKKQEKWQKLVGSTSDQSVAWVVVPASVELAKMLSKSCLPYLLRLCVMCCPGYEGG